MTDWKTLREELNVTEEEAQLIAFEEDLIRTMVKVREDQRLSQLELAKKCKIRQPAIARLERGNHSPRLDTMLRVLAPLGYTLRIVPIE